MTLIPSNEIIGQAVRMTVPMFPEIAVRELVAKALVNQDFFVTGTGPMVEIFEGRIEITASVNHWWTREDLWIHRPNRAMKC